MSAQPGPARWWLVDLLRDQRPDHFLVRAPGRRQALSSFRADMIRHFRAHSSLRWATEKVRIMEPVIVAGPLTPAEALDHALGWAWAWEITRRAPERTTVLCEPASPAPRETAERALGLRRARLIEQDVAAAYLESAAVTAPASARGRPQAADGQR